MSALDVPDAADNTIMSWLRAGDLRTDGTANEVAELVTADPALLPDLMSALHSADDPLRGRAADALEKVARAQSDQVLPYLEQVSDLARRDPVPMVRWHLAMVLGYLSPATGEQDEQIWGTLRYLLDDQSAFVRSWAIVSACLLAQRQPAWAEQIMEALQPLQTDDSKAVRTRVRKALAWLLEPAAGLPVGWDKRRT